MTTRARGVKKEQTIAIRDNGPRRNRRVGSARVAAGHAARALLRGARLAGYTGNSTPGA
jgi:hypothetical protein